MLRSAFSRICRFSKSIHRNFSNSNSTYTRKNHRKVNSVCKICSGSAYHPSYANKFDLVNIVFQQMEQNIHTTGHLQRGKKHSHGETSDSDSDSDGSDEEFETFEEDEAIASTAKEREFIVTSMRVDNILANTVGTNRTTTEEEFYDNKIRVNGRIPKKKALQVAEGDYIDRIISEDGEQYKIQRVRVLKIKSERTAKKNKLRVICRNWLKPFWMEKNAVDR